MRVIRSFIETNIDGLKLNILKYNIRRISPILRIIAKKIVKSRTSGEQRKYNILPHPNKNHCLVNRRVAGRFIKPTLLSFLAGQVYIIKPGREYTNLHPAFAEWLPGKIKTAHKQIFFAKIKKETAFASATMAHVVQTSALVVQTNTYVVQTSTPVSLT